MHFVYWLLVLHFVMHAQTGHSMSQKHIPFVDTTGMIWGADKHSNAALVRTALRQVAGDVQRVPQVHALDGGVTNNLFAINRYPASQQVILSSHRYSGTRAKGGKVPGC